MIHPKVSSPSYNPLKKRTSPGSGRTLVQSVQTIKIDHSTSKKVSIDVEPTDSIDIIQLLEEEKHPKDMSKISKKKKESPIAPDVFYPNSVLRSMFKMEVVKPAEVKMFQLRLIPPTTPDKIENELNERMKRYSVLTNLDGIHATLFQTLKKIDILERLKNQNNKNINWQNDDDEWVEMEDPDILYDNRSPKPTSAKKSKGHASTSVLPTRQKDTIPDIFKRMRNEKWWRQSDDESNNNLRSMLLHLIEIISTKQVDSYESACNYIVEIFRTYGIEPSLVDHIISILLGYLQLGENDPLDVHTIRTMAQFMIERKAIIVPLLEFMSKCQPDNALRLETENAVKLITDVNSSDDIDLALNNMSTVRDADEDTFSLKTIIQKLRLNKTADGTGVITEQADENEQIHPLLKKIFEERWFPRGSDPITLDLIIDAILAKLPTASKSLIKTLTTHLINLHREIGYTKEQFDRVAKGLISLLSHTDADYRLLAGTVLAAFGKETKAIDIALLNSYRNDQRVLVRTECCDSLKKLSGITSETVLTDCANNISYLETLPEENFTLQNYLNLKNHVGTTTTTTEQQPIDDENFKSGSEENKIEMNNEDPGSQFPIDEINNDVTFARSRTPSPQIDEQEPNLFSKNQTASQFSMYTGIRSSTDLKTPVEPLIRVEINDKTKSAIQSSQHGSQSRRKPVDTSPSSSQTPRLRRQPTVSNEPQMRTTTKHLATERVSRRRGLLLPNNSDMWNSYAKQSEILEENTSDVQPPTEITETHSYDSIQAILNEHKRTVGYYRVLPNRRVLIPHKISVGNVFGDQINLTIDKKFPIRATSSTSSTMRLSDLNHNKRHLHEVESIQLLSSLVIRAINLHRQHESLVPGPFSIGSNSSENFTDALTISQMQLHSFTDLHQANFYMPHKLPPIVRERPSSAEFDRMKTNVKLAASRTGIDLRKATDMEDVLSHAFSSEHDVSKATFSPVNPLHAAAAAATTTTRRQTTDEPDITHAWLIEQLLRSHGATDSPNYIQQINRSYPKFTPLLHSRVPRHVIPIIWNDPIMKQIANIVANKYDDLSSIGDNSIKRTKQKSTVPTFDEEHSSNFFDYTASSYISAMQQQRDEQKKKFLPPIHGTKIRLPRHVVKFGFREIEKDSPETSIDILRDEHVPKSRRRRIYMHLMMSVNENIFARHELVKTQLRHMLKTDPTIIPTKIIPT